MSYPAVRAKRSRQAKFYIEKNSLGEFIWRFKAPNGVVIISGESCKNKADCKRAIETLRKYAANADVLDQTIAVDAAVSKP